jgi:hypothetical protein
MKNTNSINNSIMIKTNKILRLFSVLAVVTMVIILP